MIDDFIENLAWDVVFRYKSREEAIEEAKEYGYNKSRIKCSIECAKRMLKMNISIEDISDVTNLPVEEIRKLMTEQ